jgi:PAS domain S-box-containing protein
VDRILALPIRVQLLLFAALVAIPAAALIVVSGLRLRAEAILHAEVETQQVAEAIVAEQRNLVAGLEQVVTVLAQLPEVRTHDPRVRSLLEAVLTRNPAYSNLFLADRNGMVWASGVPRAGFSVADRRYVVNALRTGQLSSGEYVMSRATGRPAFNFGYPLRDARGEISGVVGIGLSIDSLRQRVLDARFPSRPNFVLLDHRGVILSRGLNEGSWVGRPYPADSFEEMASGPDARTFEGPGLQRDRRIITYRKLSLPGEPEPFMYVRTGIPVESALADANRALVRNVALFLSFLLLAVAVVVRTGKRSIVDRVVALEDASRRVAAGDLAVRVSDVVRGGELGRLGETFDAMAARLSEREEAILESERKYHEIFDATSEGVLVAAATGGEILEANRAAQRIFGRERDELLGMALDELCPPPQEGGPAPEAGRSYECSARRKDGTGFRAEATVQPTSLGGEGRVLAVVRDVTARWRAAEEYARLQSELQHAQKMESVGRLAGGVAHDFNNMLTVMLGEAGAIQKLSAPGSPAHDSATEIQRAALRSRDVTRQLLAFSRKQIATPRVVDLNVLAAEMRHALARLIGEEVELVLVPGAELWPVRFDPAQLDQVLVNLVVNARDAMPGGGRIVVETRNAVVGEPHGSVLGIPPGDYALLSVSDDGVGMDEDTLSHVFEPFFTTKRSGQGTGLGLATVYGVVTQNRGHIRVESAPGSGATFRIYFPRAEEAPARTREPSRAAVPGRGRVLLVEDEEMVRTTARKMLESLGYEVTSVPSATEALAAFERRDVRFDLLLTDVVMPEMRGTELRERLARVRPDLPTVFMSGYTAEAPVIGHGDGAGYLQKPFSALELARELERMLHLAGRGETGRIELTVAEA